MLNLGEYRKVVTFDQHVTGILECGEQVQGLFEVVSDPLGRFFCPDNS
jgi:hypothetical protein